MALSFEEHARRYGGARSGYADTQLVAVGGERFTPLHVPLLMRDKTLGRKNDPAAYNEFRHAFARHLGREDPADFSGVNFPPGQYDFQRRTVILNDASFASGSTILQARINEMTKLSSMTLYGDAEMRDCDIRSKLDGIKIHGLVRFNSCSFGNDLSLSNIQNEGASIDASSLDLENISASNCNIDSLKLSIDHCRNIEVRGCSIDSLSLSGSARDLSALRITFSHCRCIRMQVQRSGLVYVSDTHGDDLIFRQIKADSLSIESGKFNNIWIYGGDNREISDLRLIRTKVLNDLYLVNIEFSKSASFHEIDFPRAPDFFSASLPNDVTFRKCSFPRRYQADMNDEDGDGLARDRSEEYPDYSMRRYAHLASEMKNISNREAELEFRKWEAFWHNRSSNSKLQKVIYHIYGISSDYGISISKPFWLYIIMAVSEAIMLTLAEASSSRFELIGLISEMPRAFFLPFSGYAVSESLWPFDTTKLQAGYIVFNALASLTRVYLAFVFFLAIRRRFQIG